LQLRWHKRRKDRPATSWEPQPGTEILIEQLKWKHWMIWRPILEAVLEADLEDLVMAGVGCSEE